MDKIRYIYYAILPYPKRYIMRCFVTIFIISLAFLSLYGCTKNKKDDGAGKGGNANLTIYPQHHQVAKNLRDMVVYIKYQTSVPPANGIYDDSAVCTMKDTVPVAVLNGLKNGNYYIFGRGKDTSINQSVKGGIPYTISMQSDQVVYLPVTED